MTNSDPWPIIDQPKGHGMFMLGTTTLYLCHMPMFTMEPHHYQCTLQAHLDAASMATYRADKAAHPDCAYNLTNPDSFQFTLPDLVTGVITSYPAVVYREYDGSNGGTPRTEIIGNATVHVDRVVYFRPFDEGIPRPEALTYLLFGDQQEAHLDHYIAADPDFQHLLTLPVVPAWLSPVQLQAGVAVSFVGTQSMPIPCAAPLASGTHSVLFQGIATAQVSLQVSGAFWFSTGNSLNAVDPCPAAPPRPPDP